MSTANADGLSRLPLSSAFWFPCNQYSLYYNFQIEALLVTSSEIAAATRTDPVISKVYNYTLSGWPGKTEEVLQPYKIRQELLTVEGGCLLWGIRVIIPTKHRDHILKELHRDHPGCSWMKSVAHSYQWWPGLDSDTEQLAKVCASASRTKMHPHQPLYIHGHGPPRVL